MKATLGVALLLLLCAIGCDRNRPEGPAERFGRHVDNTADEIHDDAVRSGHNARAMAHDVHERLKTDNAVEPADRDYNR